MAKPSDQEIKDLRDQAKIDAAYEKSLRLTAPAPAASAASTPKKMAKGGSASKRADGIAMRGKTRGKLV